MLETNLHHHDGSQSSDHDDGRKRSRGTRSSTSDTEFLKARIVGEVSGGGGGASRERRGVCNHGLEIFSTGVAGADGVDTLAGIRTYRGIVL